jgi:transposase
LDDGVIEQQPAGAEKLILDFGDSYFIDELLEMNGFKTLIKETFGGLFDTVMSLVLYRSLQQGASYYAQVWWEGSYSRILYPTASLASQRISETLKAIGDESIQRDFFHGYLRYIAPLCRKSILLDSTGLPNDISFPLTAINNHGGEISNEARLVLVLDKDSGMPIYFRYVAGNIVDVSTLKTTLSEVAAHGIDVWHAIVDAGYYSEKNIRALQESQISFVMRMVSNRKKYKVLVSEHASDIEDAKYLVKYRDRFVYIKRVEIDLFGKTGYAYVAEDMDRKHEEVKKYVRGALDNNDISSEDMNTAIQEKGLFILIASDPIETSDILPLYYTRQAIEQVFDIGKNNSDLLPLRVHGLETFRGHLLLSFLASAIYIMINKMLKKSDFCAIGAYRILRNLKCKVFDTTIVVQEANKKMNEIAKLLKLDFPTNIQLSCGEKNKGN